MAFLNGKRALITGLASERSIAWGIANAMKREGAELAFTYQNEKLKSRVEKFAEYFDAKISIPCDVGNDNQIEALEGELSACWDGLDILVHSIAYAPRDQLEGLYLDAVTRQGFSESHEISSYSFAALAKQLKGMMTN